MIGSLVAVFTWRRCVAVHEVCSVDLGVSYGQAGCTGALLEGHFGGGLWGLVWGCSGGGGGDAGVM